LFVAALIAGLAGAILVWAFASHYLALFIVSSDQRDSQGVVKKRSRAFEIALCGTLFLICILLAFLIAFLLTG
jgi:cell division protein FtsX